MPTHLMFACDVDPDHDARQLICGLYNAGIEWFKFERHLIHPEMRQTINLVRRLGGKVMLDLKLYGTRDTARARLLEARDAGANMVTVHEDCLPHITWDQLGHLKVIGVHRLTDGTGGDHWCRTAMADGIVCSAEWAGYIRRNEWVGYIRRNTKKILVTPGGRSAGQDPNNHVDVSGAAAAREAGVDFYVVGRPVYEAPDPVAAARRIMRELR